MRLPTEAEVLQISAVAVAAPRYMGAFASAIGISIVQAWPWFAGAEIWSGLAMAVLEGWAIAFIARRWRATRAKWPWRVLLGLWLALIVTLPLVATPYLLSSQYDLAVIDIMPWWAVALWSFLVAAVAPLVLVGVGYADTQRPESRQAVSTEPAEPKKEPAKRLAEQESYSCPACLKEFPTYQGLNAHKRFCTNGAGEKIKTATAGEGEWG